MKKLMSAWAKFPPNMQNILVSTIVCIVMTASGASVETCQAVQNILSGVSA